MGFVITDAEYKISVAAHSLAGAMRRYVSNFPALKGSLPNCV